MAKFGMKWLEAHGYEYRFTMVWEKSEDKSKEASGLGFWMQNSHEDCLVASKGDPGLLLKFTKRMAVKSSIYANREAP